MVDASQHMGVRLDTVRPSRTGSSPVLITKTKDMAKDIFVSETPEEFEREFEGERDAKFKVYHDDTPAGVVERVIAAVRELYPDIILVAGEGGDGFQDYTII